MAASLLAEKQALPCPSTGGAHLRVPLSWCWSSSGSLRGTVHPIPQNYTTAARWELAPAPPPCMSALAGLPESPACALSAPGTRSFLELEKQAVSSSAPWGVLEGCTGGSATSTAS